MATSSSPPAGPAWLDARIRAGRTILLDGGTGTELERRGVPMNDRIWCGDATLAHADVLRGIHEDYIRAGASVITANTFAAARHALEPAGFGSEVERANRAAVDIAREARDRAARGEVAIAGSVSDFIAREADPGWRAGRRLRATYREQTEILAEAGVDLIALEMMQEPEIAVAAIEAALATGLPVWVGCSCRRVGDARRLALFDYPDRDFGELLDAISAYPVAVMGIMHSEIPDTLTGIEALRERWTGPMAAYPESGYFEMPSWHFVDIVAPADLVDEARGWLESGVRIVGGCCGIGPPHIAALHAALVDAPQP